MIHALIKEGVFAARHKIKTLNSTAVRKEKEKVGNGKKGAAASFLFLFLFPFLCESSREEKKIPAVDWLWVITPPCSGLPVTWTSAGGVRAAISLFLCLGWCVIASPGD